MIKNTFHIFKGISKEKEEELWNTGIKDWNDFLKIDTIKGISYDKKKNYDMQIKKAIMKLEDEEHDYFINVLPIKLHYRYYPMIRDELIYIDIESYGHTKSNEITII